MVILKKVLIVDDNAINREMLKNIISREYEVLEAANGAEALDVLNRHLNEITAIMLDVVMPVMDGYGFLSIVKKAPLYKDIPILIMTVKDGKEEEKKALSLGAWDFITKPYDPDIVVLRLNNAIFRSQMSAFAELKYMAEYDRLTGIFNKTEFFAMTERMLTAYSEEKFVFARFDINRFQLVNEFFGMEEGDRLLKFIAVEIRELFGQKELCTYGRIQADIFGFCMPYDVGSCTNTLESIRAFLTKFNSEYNIVPTIGLCIIDDNSVSAETLYTRASLAAKQNKGSVIEYYTYYNDSMSAKLQREQEITNEMVSALESGQFDVYIQPKYSIQTNTPYGGEALVRWFHPVKGMISPGEFIPVFERNGFITKLDYYVWKRACQLIRMWLDTGRTVHPISVNVSRVNLYNPNIADIIINLVHEYDISPALLNIELTESAYTDNPKVMKSFMSRLQNEGFVIMMDDFGSGYSSLNVLKDISVDILKVDMQFIALSEVEGRGETILTSVVRMAKWLNMPVIIEGVETSSQVIFLRSIGCDYVQGYYYAKPMSVADYEHLIDTKRGIPHNIIASSMSFDIDEMFSSNPKMGLLFSSLLQTIVIYEYCEDGSYDLLRVNDGFYEMFGMEDLAIKSVKPIELIDSLHRERVRAAFQSTVDSRGTAECEYIRNKSDGTSVWIHIKLQYIQKVGERHLIFGTLRNITEQKTMDIEINEYRAALSNNHFGGGLQTMLIVDDYEINRSVLAGMFEKEFRILEADNGEAALELLDSDSDVDIIMLDMVMPVMDGREFLIRKALIPDIANIPVIVISADNSIEKQMKSVKFGINDYITKPFVPDVVELRVRNVMDSVSYARERAKEVTKLKEKRKRKQT